MPTAPRGTSIDLETADASARRVTFGVLSAARGESALRGSKVNSHQTPLECLSWFPGEISFDQDLIARIEAACAQPTYRSQNASQVVYMAIREWFAVLDVAARDRVLTALLAYSLGHVDELRTQNTERSEDSAVVISFIRRLLLGASPSEGSLIDKLAAIRHGVSHPPMPLSPMPTIEPITQAVVRRVESVVDERSGANSHMPLAFAQTVIASSGALRRRQPQSDNAIHVSDSAVIDEQELIQDPLLRTEIMAAYRELFGITKVSPQELMAIISRIDSTDLIVTFDLPSNQDEFKQSAERELRIFSLVLEYFEKYTDKRDSWVIDRAREQLFERIRALPPLEVVVAAGESGPELVIAHPSVHVVNNKDVFILFSREGGVYELPIEAVVTARHGDTLAPKLLSAAQSRVLKNGLVNGVFGPEGSHNVNYTPRHFIGDFTQSFKLPKIPEKMSFTEVINNLAQMTGTFVGRVARVLRDESDFSDFLPRRESQNTNVIADLPEDGAEVEQPRHRHADYRQLEKANDFKRPVRAPANKLHKNVQPISVMIRSLHSSLKLHGGINLNPDDNLYYPIEGYRWKAPDDPHNFMIVPLSLGEVESCGKPDPYQGNIAVVPEFASSVQRQPKPAESVAPPSKRSQRGWANIIKFGRRN